MRPEDAVSPLAQVHDLVVLYTLVDTTDEHSWSLASLRWGYLPNPRPAYAMRWNGELNNPEDKGSPRSHNRGTWFILPDVLGKALHGLLRSGEMTGRDLSQMLQDFSGFLQGYAPPPQKVDLTPVE